MSIVISDSALAADSSMTPAGLYQKARRLKDAGKLTESIAIFDQSLALNSKYDEARKGRADTFYLLGNYRKAIDDYSELLKSSPDSAPLHLARAEAYLHANDFPKAIEDAKLSTIHEPKNPRPYMTLAEAYSAAGKHAESLAIYNQIQKLAQNDSAIYCNRGAQQLYLKQYRDSISDYNKAISLTPSKSAAYAGRGQVYQAQGQYGKAIADYDKAIAIDKGFKWLIPLREQCKERLNRKDSEHVQSVTTPSKSH